MVKAAGPGGNVLLLADAGPYDLTGSITISSGGAAGAPVTIKGVALDGTEKNVVINGTRPTSWDPLNPAGNEIFRISGNGSNLTFENMEFNNVKNAFHVISDLSNITVKDMSANNVERFFDDLAGGKYKTASISGLTIENVDVTNFSKGVVRLQYDTNSVVIRDVHGNSGNLDGANFAIGVHLDGTVHGVLIKDSSMGNITDTTSYYWNGDGFATEGGVYDVRFEDTRAYGNTDAGYDLKSSSTILVNAVAEDNKKNFRLWGDETLINPISKNPNMRGGSGEQLHVQVMNSGAAKIIGGTFTDASNATTVIKIEGGTLTIKGTAIVHAAGAQVLNVANPASVVESSALKVANVAGVLGASIGWQPGNVTYGTADANVFAKAVVGNEVLYGGKTVDTFFFDTSNGAVLGADTIRNFGSEDRIVTTSLLVDRDRGPQLSANRSDQFVSVDGGTNVKVFGTNGKVISKMELLDTINVDGVIKYVYGTVDATGSTTVVESLLKNGVDLADVLAAKLLPPNDVTHGNEGGPVTVTLPEAVVDHVAAPAPVASAPVTAPPVAEAVQAPAPTPAPVLVYDVAPSGAIVSSSGNDQMTGTASKDVFFFDTASGASFGNDSIRNFSSGDRIVTTSAIFDGNNDGRIKANASDRLLLPTADPSETTSSGTLKIFHQNGKAVSTIALLDTYVEHGHTYYVYGQVGDQVAGASLTFDSHLVDTGLFA